MIVIIMLFLAFPLGYWAGRGDAKWQQYLKEKGVLDENGNFID